jgi:hypothetical protein
MSASPCNKRAHRLSGATALLMLSSLAVVPALALSPGDPTPIGLPQGQSPDPATPPADSGSVGSGGVQSSPLPPLPAPPPEGTMGAATPPAPGTAAPGTTTPGTISQPQQPTGQQPTTATQAAPADTGAPGLLEDSNAGLGANLWQGTSSAQLISLMPRLPAPQLQPSLRDLQVRLLLTKAAGPNAGGGIDTLVPLRAERLHAMGFSAEALLLTKGPAAGAPADARGAFEKALADGDANACAKADEAINAQQVLDLYWRKVLLYCQIVREQDEQARIGLDLMREMPAKDQATKDYVALAAVLLDEGNKKKLKLKSDPDALQAAMMKKVGLKPKTAQASAAPKLAGPAEAAAIARDASQPLDLRIERGEYAFAIGLITADELINLYRQVKFTGDPLALPDSPNARGQLYQAADQAFDPVRRAQFVQRALQAAKARSAYFWTGTLYRPIADKVTPAPNLAWFAPEAARLMFWSGNVDKGGFWLNLAQGVQNNPQAASTVPGLNILGQIAGVTGSYDSDPVAAWQAANPNNGAAADKLRGIQAGLGLPGIAAVSFPAPSGETAAIAEAAQKGRRGETVLLSLIALGGRGLGAADGATLAQSLGGLGAVGLGPEAKRIALEAAILAGL